MLGLPNKMPHADFMTRYSIIAPKIFADMAADPKGCATKALPESGLDIDDFRCGHTKVKLSGCVHGDDNNRDPSHVSHLQRELIFANFNHE